MADNFTANAGAGGDTFAADDILGIKYPRSKITLGADGANDGDVSASNPMPVTGTVAVTGTFWQATQPVSIASAITTKPDGTVWTLTGTSANVNITNASVAVTGTFWQATQPVSAASLPLPSNAAQETGGNLATLVTRTTLGQTTMSASRPVAIASDQSQIPVIQGAAATQTYNVAGVITINTVLLTIDLSQYRGASIQCTSMGTTGVVTPEWSNDNATWVAATIFTPPGASATTFNAAGLWNAPKQARYLRLRLSTATTAGTTTIFTEAYSDRPQVWFATQPVSLATNTPTLAAGTNLAADVGVQYRATATGGASTLSVLSPATPAATAIKAGAGRLIGAVLVNSAATVRSVKFWNTAVAGVTMGTTAAIFEWDIPPGGFLQFQLPGGIGFATAITYAVTGAKGLTDNTAITLNDVSGAFFFA